MFPFNHSYELEYMTQKHVTPVPGYYLAVFGSAIHPCAAAELHCDFGNLTWRGIEGGRTAPSHQVTAPCNLYGNQ